MEKVRIGNRNMIFFISTRVLNRRSLDPAPSRLNPHNGNLVYKVSDTAEKAGLIQVLFQRTKMQPNLHIISQLFKRLFDNLDFFNQGTDSYLYQVYSPGKSIQPCKTCISLYSGHYFTQDNPSRNIH